MYIDPDLRDRVYQLFSLEVPKLLQTIEDELVNLSVDRNATSVNNLLRAAHSIKGGAASLGLVAIEDLAHQIEDIFRVLSHPELPFNGELERLLFQIYDCLARLVTYEIEQQPVPIEFHTKTQIVLADLDEEIGHFVIAGRQTPIGTSSGIDLTQSIFEVDVAQSLIRLERILLDPSGNPLAVSEFRAQAEVFIGISQLLNLPEFGDLAQATIVALDRHPDRDREICCFALHDFYQALTAVLTGDRQHCGTISPGFAFLLAESPNAIEPQLDWELPFEPADIEQLCDSVPEIGADSDLRFDLERIFESKIEDAAPEIGVEMLALAPLTPPNLGLGSIEPSSLLEFDIIELFDRLPVAHELNSRSIEFDLLELFDLPIAVGNGISPAIGSTSLHYDLIELFGAPQSLMSLPRDSHRRQAVMAAIAQISAEFDRLPTLAATAFRPPQVARLTRVKKSRPLISTPIPQLSVRVGIDRLERMNNLLGELTIERHGLALYNAQVRDNLLRMRDNCERFEAIGDRLRQLADRISVATQPAEVPTELTSMARDLSAQFDALELDRYNELHNIAQATTEQVAQIAEQLDDLTLFNTQSDRQIERQKQLLSYLHDDLRWARMLPLGDIFNRFPRTLHDLSVEYHKPVDLKITGAGVLVNRGAIDKLLDPMLHLLRNAFDHGIDSPAVRQAAGKAERGSIEIHAYHQGSQTVIELRDDGNGIDLARIKTKAISLELLDGQTAVTATDAQILDFIFMPGFSTSDRVTKLSGRGMGLDIVKAQLQAIKGTISIDSQVGRGTTFTLRIPLTLTIAQLMLCQVGHAVYAFPADSIQRIVIPTTDRLEQHGESRCLRWQERRIPIYNLADLLAYSVSIPDRPISQTLTATMDNPSDWLSPLLIIDIGERTLALQIDRSLSEQELTIVPFGRGITPPSYTYGCTILGDGAILPVIDLHTLIRVTIDLPHCAIACSLPPSPLLTSDLQMILVIDDSVTTRQSLCLTLEKFGYRTLQAKDGQEALQLMRQQASELKLAICDIEMPNLNGFEFLNIWRQDDRLTHIPVAMLTSRSNTKHREFATHLGAVAYFTKPYIEQDLVTAISRISG